ncbi:hypothetical protein MKK69_30560 [Methylobacterium sp. J-026]|nr:hypothetical protein [Methylobacterium sp. J-026]MCJ2138346.1 hypothetical protein [Methylobacterium sp. J-026]
MRAETARRDFERIAGLIAAAGPLAPGTEAMSDLEMLEVATALATART